MDSKTDAQPPMNDVALGTNRQLPLMIANPIQQTLATVKVHWRWSFLRDLSDPCVKSPLTNITKQNEAPYCRSTLTNRPGSHDAVAVGMRQNGRIMSPPMGPPWSRQNANDAPASSCECKFSDTQNKMRKTPTARAFCRHSSPITRQNGAAAHGFSGPGISARNPTRLSNLSSPATNSSSAV